jgi:hypothetical protein
MGVKEVDCRFKLSSAASSSLTAGSESRVVSWRGPVRRANTDGGKVRRCAARRATCPEGERKVDVVRLISRMLPSSPSKRLSLHFKGCEYV